MKYSIPQNPSRQGAIAPLAAILIVFLLGLVAFAVDIGWIVISKHQLQNAADAGALAGVDSLMDGYVQYQLAKTDSQKQMVLDSTLNSARELAKKYAGYNRVGELNQIITRDVDIEFGFTSSAYKYTRSCLFCAQHRTDRDFLSWAFFGTNS